MSHGGISVKTTAEDNMLKTKAAVVRVKDQRSFTVTVPRKRGDESRLVEIDEIQLKVLSIVESGNHRSGRYLDLYGKSTHWNYERN